VGRLIGLMIRTGYELLQKAGGFYPRHPIRTAHSGFFWGLRLVAAPITAGAQPTPARADSAARGGRNWHSYPGLMQPKMPLPSPAAFVLGLHLARLEHN
jgi:hypothetical protein